MSVTSEDDGAWRVVPRRTTRARRVNFPTTVNPVSMMNDLTTVVEEEVVSHNEVANDPGDTNTGNPYFT